MVTIQGVQGGQVDRRVRARVNYHKRVQVDWRGNTRLCRCSERLRAHMFNQKGGQVEWELRLRSHI